jgi:pimeloyl-ACP methyl ester carboxylesterase
MRRPPASRTTKLLALAFVLAGVIAVAAQPALRGVEAALVLADIGAGPKPSLLKKWTDAPERSAVTYDVAGRHHEADLYRGPHPRAELIVVPGALATGKDDPRLVAFAETLARAKFEVLVPDIPSVRELRLRASDAEDVADAVAHESAGAPGPLGIVGLSYAAGPAILALLDPATGSKVAFCLAIGGYYDPDAVFTFFTTGYYRDPPGGPWRHREPNAYGKWLFVAGNVGLVSSATDADLLARIAARKLDDLSADIGDLAKNLGPEGRSILDFVDNTDPGRAAVLIAALPETVKREIAALDLKRRNLAKLTTRLILLHGRDDVIVPESESMALAEAAPDSRLYLIERLAHVDLGPVGLRDALTLWRAVCRLLEERDGAV